MVSAQMGKSSFSEEGARKGAFLQTLHLTKAVVFTLALY